MCDLTSAWLYGTETNDRTTTTKATSVRNNWVQKIARVTRADKSAEELDSETGEEQTTVGRTCRKDGRSQTTEESGIVT